MPYAQLLSNLIESKKLPVKEIARRCNADGVDITPAYISMIKNPANEKIPSDKISRALAKACEVEPKYEDVLVIEAYIDKAPDEFRRFLDDYRNILIESMVMFFGNQVESSDLRIIKDNLKVMPMALLILESSSLNQKENFKKAAGSMNTKVEIKDGSIQALINLKEPEGFLIEDNSMYPVIMKGSKVNIDSFPLDEYKNGDILLVVVKGSKKPICRKCLFLDEPRMRVALMAYDQAVPAENYKIEDITIMGKVKRIITELE